MHLRTKKGLNLPLKGEPKGDLQQLPDPSVAFLDLDH